MNSYLIRFTEIFQPVVGDRSIGIVDGIAGVKIDGLRVKLDGRAVFFMLEALVGLGLQFLSLFDGFG